jgi:putrescine transport system permease protein
MVSWLDQGIVQEKIVFDNFTYLWEDDLYVDTYINSVRIAGLSTVICLFIGYPIGCAIVRATQTTKNILLLMIILPFWTSFLLRVYAWMGLLANQDTINDLLIYLGIIEEPIRPLYTQFAVYVGIIYTYLTFILNYSVGKIIVLLSG